MSYNSNIINACINQDLAALKYYHSKGYDFNSIFDSVGDSLLHIAIKNNLPKSFDLLLELGVNIEIKEQYFDLTPLNYCAFYNSINFAKKLIEHGADVNTQDSTQYTPLNNAVFFQNYAFANYMLTLPEVDVNIPGINETTPMMWMYVDGQYNTLQKTINHPQFDATFNYILLSDQAPMDPIFSDMMNYLEHNGKSIDYSLVDLIHEIKVFGLKYDFAGTLFLSELDIHGDFAFSFEGYSNEEGIQKIALSFDPFYQYAEQSGIPEWAKTAFSVVHESIVFSQQTTNPSAYYDKILSGAPVLIPSGWDGHSIGFVIHGDRLYRCNRGEHSDGIHGIDEYIITNPSNLSPYYIQMMLVASGSSQEFNQDIIDYLGLELVGQVENPGQIAGNCVWTSLETSVEALFITTFLEMGMDNESAHQLAKQNFSLWENYDLNMSLQHIIAEPELLLQNEIYDDLLINIIEAHHDANDVAEVERGVIILNQLDEPSVFATFDEKIGSYVMEYSPQSYETISFLNVYAPTVLPPEPTYFEAWTQWLFPPAIDLTPDEIILAKEYLDFLSACDQYQATHPTHVDCNMELQHSLVQLFSDIAVQNDQAIYV